MGSSPFLSFLSSRNSHIRNLSQPHIAGRCGKSNKEKIYFPTSSHLDFFPFVASCRAKEKRAEASKDKKDTYGTKDKIGGFRICRDFCSRPHTHPFFSPFLADGILLKVNHLNVVMQARGDPLQHYKGQVPLLVVEIKDFVFQQTDEFWKVVDLSTARKINKNKDVVCVFREAAMRVSAHLVPCFSQTDPSYTILNGQKLKDFGSSADSTGNKNAGGPLGSTVLLNNIDLKIRFIFQRNPRDNSIVGVQMNPIFPMLEFTLNPLNISMIQTWVEAFQHILGNVIVDGTLQSASPLQKKTGTPTTTSAPPLSQSRFQPASSFTSVGSSIDSEESDLEERLSHRKSRIAVAFAADVMIALLLFSLAASSYSLFPPSSFLARQNKHAACGG